MKAALLAVDGRAEGASRSTVSAAPDATTSVAYSPPPPSASPPAAAAAVAAAFDATSWETRVNGRASRAARVRPSLTGAARGARDVGLVAARKGR